MSNDKTREAFEANRTMIDHPWAFWQIAWQLGHASALSASEGAAPVAAGAEELLQRGMHLLDTLDSPELYDQEKRDAASDEVNRTLHQLAAVNGAGLSDAADLREALQFYADGQHEVILSGCIDWDAERARLASEGYGQSAELHNGNEVFHENGKRARDALAAPDAQARPVAVLTKPHCRDCADFGPICPNSGEPCAAPTAPPAEAQPAPAAEAEPVAYLITHPAGDVWANAAKELTPGFRRVCEGEGCTIEPLYTRPAAPLSEVERLRAEQSAAAMPLIGPLLDAWEWSRCVEGFKVEHAELDKHLRAIDNAMEGRAPSPSPQPTDEATDAQPMQPLAHDAHGVLRFKPNALVNALYEHGVRTGMGLNELHVMDFTDEDRRQFAQLIGYSLDGYGTLQYVDADAYDRAAMSATPGGGKCR